MIKRLAKYYGVKVYLSNNNTLGGFYVRKGKKVGIHISKTARRKLSVFFHELGHHHCCTMGIWRSYHQYPHITKTGRIKLDKKTARGAIMTGFKAECWVDQWAAKEMAKWYPNRTYYGGYGTEYSRLWLKNNHLSWYKQFL